MLIDGVPHRSIRVHPDRDSVEIIDQALLPYQLQWARLGTVEEAASAIRTMQVRGAPLIGVTAAFGIWLALREDPQDGALARALCLLGATRPTAVNLSWALEQMRLSLEPQAPERRALSALARAEALAEAEVEACKKIGDHGLVLLRQAFERRRERSALQVLTHCNAGWLATVDWGTALAPVYRAHQEGLPVHVWVDETRPRNQGALTAWELSRQGIPHTFIVDNEAGILMQRGRIDLCLVGADRVTSQGDVCNKIGTYLKALAAFDNQVPFYAAMPASTIDWTLSDGAQIPIEERDGAEVRKVRGVGADGRAVEVEVTLPGCAVSNHAFDLTPARLVTAIITERGSCPATARGLEGLFPEGSR